MSFNCLYFNHDSIIIGADSRESFLDGSHNDKYQKVFYNREQKIIWSLTGIYKYRNIDYTALIEQIMNTSAAIHEKIKLIEYLMKYPTEKYKKETGEDGIFDIFIGALYDGKLRVLVCEVKNGEPNIDECKVYDKLVYPISSGVTGEFVKYLDMKKIDETNDEKIKMEEMTRIVKLAIDKDTTKTIGGTPYVAILNSAGSICLNFE